MIYFMLAINYLFIGLFVTLWVKNRLYVLDEEIVFFTTSILSWPFAVVYIFAKRLYNHLFPWTPYLDDFEINRLRELSAQLKNQDVSKYIEILVGETLHGSWLIHIDFESLSPDLEV